MKLVLFSLLLCSSLVASNRVDEPSRRLWNNTPSLQELASSTAIKSVVSKGDPQPFGLPGSDGTPNISSLKMKVSLWGPPERLTLSINKNDIWDRRKGWEDVITLNQIKDSYFYAGNKDNRNPKGLQSAFYMTKDGEWIDPYASWRVYPFPCPKPAGQVIVMCDDFLDIAQPETSTACRDGVTELQLQSGEASATLKYLNVMEENLIAIQGDYSNIARGLKLRLYRHRDTYDPQKIKPNKQYEDYNIQADSAWNQALDEPEGGADDRFFWIKQQLPSEKTFPGGFEYVMMGLIAKEAYVIDTVTAKKGLGTVALAATNLISYEDIRNAPGTAATATLNDKKADFSFTAYITVVTSNDCENIIAEAKQKLLDAKRRGFESLRKKNEDWYSSLYEQREQGRIFSGDTADTKRAIPGIFYSWIDDHMMSSPDPAKYEADAHTYSFLECDAPPWHGLPCYNELYNSSYLAVFNRIDQLDYYVKLIEFWQKAAANNAKTMFGLPGLFFTHGYLPPIKADEYPHSHVNYEFAMEMPAQLMKYLWDKWDYGGDTEFLKTNVYPALRELAIFYAAYVEKGSDGQYHIEPTIPQESWVLNHRFQYNRDATPSITMFRWTFQRAAEAAALLNVDKTMSTQWLAISDGLPGFPTKDTESGPVWVPVANDPLKPVPEIGSTGKHSGVFNPVNLADEVNLDSDPELIATALRSANLLSSKHWAKNSVYHLLGQSKDRLYTYRGSSDRWHFKTMVNKGSRGPGDYLQLDSHESQVNACWIEPERLLNSRSGRIYLFPCVPDKFTVGFKNMLAKGGLAVTAELRDGTVTFLQIKAKRDNICRIVNPWPANKLILQNDRKKKVKFQWDAYENQGIEFEVKAGMTYTLYPQDR